MYYVTEKVSVLDLENFDPRWNFSSFRTELHIICRCL